MRKTFILEIVNALQINIKEVCKTKNEIRVKAGQPVEVMLDDSVRRCLRLFAIRDLGVSGYARTPSDKITFTPEKKALTPLPAQLELVLESLSPSKL